MLAYRKGYREIINTKFGILNKPSRAAAHQRIMKISCHSEDSDESEDEESRAGHRYVEILRPRLSPQGGESARRTE